MEDDQQFCLRWNNHQTTLIQNFDTLLESGTLVDCTLAAEGKYLKAHKVVLSACSPYFEGLLSEHYDKHPVFILKDVKFKELKAMMDYMYRGEVNISQDQLAALLKAAESLQIKGLSESKTGSSGSTSSSKAETRSQKTAQPSAPSLDIPHSSSGLTIEKNNKVPRQSLAQTSVGDLPEDSASPSLSKGISSREGSVSPNGRKRKRYRRRSLNDDNPIDNHETSNSSDMSHQTMNVPALGVAPVADEKSMSDPSDSLGRSALMQQLTKPADDMLPMPVEKPEPNDTLIEPKSEYLDEAEDSVEDLTLDDEGMDDTMDDGNRAGPSHDPSHPGLGSWHVTGDRSNAGGVVGSVVAGAPGSNDEVFMQAQEAAQAHRDSQGPEEKKAQKKKDTESEPEFINEESLEEVYEEEVYEEEMITYEVVEEIEIEEEEGGEKIFDIEEVVQEEIVEEVEKKNEEEMIVEEKEKKVAVKKEATKKKNKKKYKRRSKMCQCEYCGNIYAWSTSLARHLRVCRKRKDNKKGNDEPQENVEIKDEESIKKPVVKSVKILRAGAPEKKLLKRAGAPASSSKQYEHEMKKYKSADGMYTCWGCGRKYHWASSLSRHRTIHCGPRNKMKYVCKLCSYKSGYRGNFLRHLKTPRHKRNARFKKMQKIMEEAIRNEDEEEEKFEEYDI
ncbi:longitudinals lacking protein isoform X3 [Cotesia glomerata]|uniref:longitudinals lacking protein isoform X3 n=1 Tax=Cotesia glomerata TaxID=32391 RepID=UPI001D01C0F1|nr:longitudinals lacking protein isoform X3 [Cotesia glomerata]